MSDILEVIKTRRAVRAFSEREVEEEKLDKVLEAGTWAPSAMGLQPSVIVSVRDEATRAKLSKMNAAVMGSERDPFYKAPIYIVVLSKGNNFLQDGSCVLENMMLEAHSLGLGSVWINREIEMFDSAEGKALLREWGLDESLRGVGALALGYPSSSGVKSAAERKAGYILKV